MIVAIGEVVWDIFADRPDREVLGGAPINVAYHLAALGLPVRVVTRVGSDPLGDATLARLAELGLPLAGVQRDEQLPTGRVLVSFGPGGEPAYEIVAPAAWDNIDPEQALAAAVGGGRDGALPDPAFPLSGHPDTGKAAGAPGAGRMFVDHERQPEQARSADRSPAFALVFGTLAQRAPRSRQAIRRLAGAASCCYYDVNLRPPFTTRELVLESLAMADLVKVNGEELVQLGGWLDLPAAVRAGAGPPSGAGPPYVDPAREQVAAAIRERYRLAALVVTEGAAGAWAQTAEGTWQGVGEPVTVADTVGAGDAFFAALIAAHLRQHPWPEILARANRRGAYVAGRFGATP